MKSVADTDDGNFRAPDHRLSADAAEFTFSMPVPDPVDEILAQVEFYFSDANIAQDHYLLGQIAMDPTGLGFGACVNSGEGEDARGLL